MIEPRNLLRRILIAAVAALVGEDDDPVGPHGRRIGQPQHGGSDLLAEQPLTAAEHDREHHQPILIDEIMLHPFTWYAEHRVTLHSGDAVVAIDRRRRCVRSRNGAVAFYDRLLIATGSKPVVVPVPGSTLPGVVTFRDLQDVDTMLQAARTQPAEALRYE